MRRLALLLGLVAVGSLGCAGASSSGSVTGAGGSSQSGSGGVVGSCLNDMCVPPLQDPLVLDVEIDPQSSSPAGVTQILSHDVSGGDSYVVAPSAMVTVTFTAPMGGMVPSASDVVLAVPPTIPGRPNLSFQSVGASPDNGGSVAASLAVSQDALGANATLSLVPLPPSDQSMPAYNYAMAVAPTMSAALPSDDVVVSGQIETGLQKAPVSTFVARAFQGGAQVSNAPLTQADGTFQVRIPSAATTNPVTIQVSPVPQANGGAADAWFVSNAIMATAGKNLGAITLPPYQTFTTFDIVVMTPGAMALGAVNVRAQATIGPATVNGTSIGTGSYISTGATGANGIAGLFFLPGSTNTPIVYTISETPPIGSAYASTCVSATPLSSGSNGGSTPPTLATIIPMPRPVLNGTIRTSAGDPLPNVTVTASGTPSPPSAGCPSPGAVTASTTTDTSGMFSLPLDPGTYQLDYDPPAGSSGPRLTETAVAVPSGNTSVLHDVMLPAAARIVGQVVTANGTGVAAATIRFFHRQCSGQDDCFGPNRTPPLLVGKALTDSNGNFRMVVSAPTSP